MVVANSDGGSAKYAIELSRHLRPFNYNVTVADHCFSACSQFIFLGARRKYLLDDGLIAFHGAAPTDQQIDEMDLSQTNKDLLKAEGAAFRDFFREIGVSYWLIDTLPKRLRGKIDIVREFWIPTMCELRENGVKSVERINSRNFSPDC